MAAGALRIADVDFDGEFVRDFDAMVHDMYRSHDVLYLNVKKDYLARTAANRERYAALQRRYRELHDLRARNVFVYGAPDAESDAVRDLAAVVCDQRRLLANFLGHLSHVNEHAGSWETKSDASTRSRRSRGRRR